MNVKEAIKQAETDDQKEQTIADYLDPADPLPGEDHADERDQFVGDPSDEQIDPLLESMTTDHWQKYGRPEPQPDDEETADDEEEEEEDQED